MKKSGFTIIELLVVVSIIGLISSVALANFQDARQKAREAAGKQFYVTVRSSLGDKIASTWSLDEGVGFSTIVLPGGGGGSSEDEVRDSSGNNLNGTPVNVVTSDGINGNAMYFGGSAYIWGTNFPRLVTNDDLTITAWIRPEEVTGDQVLFALSGNGTTCEDLRVGISNGKGNVNGNDTTEYVIVNNVWQNITFVFHRDDSNNPLVDTYLNGTKVSTTPGIGTGECEGGNWSIGSRVSFSGGSP
ncbi:MAG TPA: LamG-like jellyroll fold domain-containing protein, partial [Candidatus Nanoarchaeia archaeon]|nr:LamG-like jellyroll fold domain-containing protein [Candidatus Nanoarchaeia archaeon]